MLWKTPALGTSGELLVVCLDLVYSTYWSDVCQGTIARATSQCHGNRPVQCYGNVTDTPDALSDYTQEVCVRCVRFYNIDLSEAQIQL